jgi:hypothetical protein
MRVGPCAGSLALVGSDITSAACAQWTEASCPPLMIGEGLREKVRTSRVMSIGLWAP